MFDVCGQLKQLFDVFIRAFLHYFLWFPFLLVVFEQIVHDNFGLEGGVKVEGIFVVGNFELFQQN
jgi:hypothetical protein